MSLAQRRTKLVLAVIEKITAEGCTDFRPGDITSRLRAQNQPLGAWEVRGELSNLEADGVVEVDAASGTWHLRTDKAQKACA